LRVGAEEHPAMSNSYGLGSAFMAPGRIRMGESATFAVGNNAGTFGERAFDGLSE
jgi:hypothetical protein